MTERGEPLFRLEFYADATGSQPLRTWLKTELAAEDRRTVGAALHQILQQQG